MLSLYLTSSSRGSSIIVSEDYNWKSWRALFNKFLRKYENRRDKVSDVYFKHEAILIKLRVNMVSWKYIANSREIINVLKRV